MTDLPSGWTRAPLGEMVRPRNVRLSPRTRPDLAFLGMDNVEPHTMRILGTVPAESVKSSAAYFEPGDVLYGRLRPYLNKVARPGFPGLASAEFMVFPDTAHLRNSYLQYRLNSVDFVRFASRLNTGDRPRVSFDQISDFQFVLPP